MSIRTRLIIDALLLAGFLAAYYPATTGLSVHEWLALGLAVVALFHLIIGWDWVSAVALRLFAKLKAATRLNLLVDTLLFVAAVTVTLSGLMVSRAVASTLGITSAPPAVWHAVHARSADATIWLFAIHAALHWKWITRASRTLIPRLAS